MRVLAVVTSFVLVLTIGAYAQMQGVQNTEKGTMKDQGNMVTKAICVLMPAGDDNVHGLVTFEQTDDGMVVTADVTGLTPGKHGFHIHEYGDCSSPDFKSAGSHLMAPGEVHAGPENPNRHIGDMGNLVADASGKAHLTLVDDKLSFTGPYSILGRAIIVHAGADDLTTQPTGNAGGRVACGTIGIAK
jgi:Cu-Zn family superoxide dismutase